MDTAVVLGLPFGLLSGGYSFAFSGSAAAAVGGGALSGVVFGALMVVTRWGPGWWRIEQLSQLSPSDRVAVMRAVQRGEPVADPRLAPGVLAVAKAVMLSAAPQNQRLGWGFLVIPAATLAVAVGETAAGSVRLAAYFGAVTVVFLGLRFALLRPGRLQRLREKAEKAQKAAGFAEGVID